MNRFRTPPTPIPTWKRVLLVVLGVSAVALLVLSLVDLRWLTKQPFADNHCVQFHCDADVVACDNGDPTDFNRPGGLPPCCSHILRDHIVDMDQIFTRHGLDYFVSHGTLLGLTRRDRMMPWTGDNDLNIPAADYEDLPNKAALLADLKAHHYSLFRYDLYRMCLTESAYDGQLLKFRISYWAFWEDLAPYIDLYPYTPYEQEFEGELVSGIVMSPKFKCLFPDSIIFPLRRRDVYGGAFSVTFPYKPEAWLKLLYGPSWHTPSKTDNGKHGASDGQMPCPYEIGEFV